MCAARKAEEGLSLGPGADLLAALGGSLVSCEGGAAAAVLLWAEGLLAPLRLPLAAAVAVAVLLAEATGATPVLLAFSAVSGWSPEALGAVVAGLFLLAAAVGSIPVLGLGAAEVPEGLTFLAAAAAAAADRLAAMAVVRWEAVGGGTAMEPGRPEDDPGGRVAPEEAPEVGREVEAVVVVVEVERGERLLTEAAVPVEGTVRAAGRG